MFEMAVIASVILAGAAAIFSFLAYMRAGRTTGGLTTEAVSSLLRAETDRIRQFGEDQARGLREELVGNLQRFQEGTLTAFRQLGDALGNRIKEFGERLDQGIKDIDARVAAIGVKLDNDIAKMGQDATANRDALRKAVETKLDDASNKQATAAREFREEMTTSFQRLIEKQEKAQEALRQTVENRLDVLRKENTDKLEQMRQTVDEKLQGTLEKRLGDSFALVSERLEQVHKGLGEMQNLATDVGGLKRVLTNVKARGTFGEIQLGALLEQVLTPDQYVPNTRVRSDSQEVVEYAVLLPGRDTDGAGVLLPIDAKFPHDDYERLLEASEKADAAGVEQAGKALEQRIRSEAKTMCLKYVNPPTTTDFAVMFLPIEGLYAEVLRRPGLAASIQREHRVTICGPTTLSAYLNALQMGFQTLAIEKRSSEVWKLLGQIKMEFGKYEGLLGKVQDRLTRASNAISDVGVRTRAINRRLRDVQAVEVSPETLLRLSEPSIDDEPTIDEAPSASADEGHDHPI